MSIDARPLGAQLPSRSPHSEPGPAPLLSPEDRRIARLSVAALVGVTVLVAVAHQSPQEAADEFRHGVDQVAVGSEQAFVGTNTIHDGDNPWEGRFSVRLMLVTPEPLSAPQINVYSVTRSTAVVSGPAAVLSATERPDGTWVTMAESPVFMAAVNDDVDIEVSAVGMEPIQASSVLAPEDNNVGLQSPAPGLDR